MNKPEELEKIKLEVKETEETLIQEILNNLDAIARVSDEIDKEIKNHDQNLETLLENLYKI